MAYRLEGRLLEFCSCGVYCPCRTTGEPDGGECDAVNVWQFDTGTIDQTDVSGLSLVALSHVHGHVLEGRPVVFYVDERATDDQLSALLAVWTGKLGGPVADLAQLIGEVAGVERAPIALELDGNQGSLQVGGVVHVELAPATEATHPAAGDGDESYGSQPAHDATTHGSPGELGARFGDICTTVPGSETSAREASSFQVKSPTYGFDLDLRDRKVIEGRFRFES